MNPRAFVRIVRAEWDEDRVVVETADAVLHYLRVDEVESNASVGDVLYHDGDTWRVESEQVWTERALFGKVIRVSDPLIIRINTQAAVAVNPGAVELQVGDVVQLNGRNEVLRTVPLSPTDEDPTSLGLEETFTPARLLAPVPAKSLGWSDFGGYEDIKLQAQILVDVHLRSREDFQKLGLHATRGVIFSGPSGTGKTHLARIIAQQSHAKLYIVTAAQLGGHLVGESEHRLEALYAHARQQPLSLIFFDEIDAITKRRDSDNGSHSSRMVNTFLTNLDGFDAPDNVVTIGTTNRPEDIDRALLRHGRFDYEIKFSLPTRQDRLEILHTHGRGITTSGELPLEHVARLTDGWTPSELERIWSRAGEFAILAGRMAIGADHLLMGLEIARLQRQEGPTR